MTTAAEEQAWNARKLADTIVEPEHCVWMYHEAAVVLGSSQRRIAAMAPEAALPIVVRDSGGGAVLVGPWLVSVSVALPNHHVLVTRNLVDSYHWIGEAHAHVLRKFGVGVTALPPDAIRVLNAGTRNRISWACFGSLSPWEVAGPDMRKLVGLAQVRRRAGVLLVAGTLIAAPDWRALAASLGRPSVDARGLSEVTTTCERELGRRLPAEEFSIALHDELGVRVR